MPIINLNKKKILFIHIPKSAGSTIEDNIINNGISLTHLIRKNSTSVISPQHYTRNDYIKEFGVKYFDHSFAIIRDPVERFVSAFTFNSHKISIFKSLNNFINDLKSNNFYVNKFDNHFVPSSEFILNDTKLFYLDEQIIENIKTYLEKILERKLYFKNMFINKGTDLKYSSNYFKTIIKRLLIRKPKSLLNPEIRSKIKDLYRDDYNLIENIKN